MELTIEENKKLIEKFPFLIPRNVWTDEIDEDYDYSYINGLGDLPDGWNRLFLLFCKHLKIELDKFNYTNKFRFTQIKEKYGSMRLYNNGYPIDSRAHELEYVFEHLSTYVCEDCGNIAKYETSGWIVELCENCYKMHYPILYEKDKCKNKLKRKRYSIKIVGYSKEAGQYVKTYDCKSYWEEYLKCTKMSDLDFIKYILTSIDIEEKE